MHKAGVGFIVPPKLKKSITEVRPINKRIITIIIDANPNPINLIHVYMPTSTSADSEIMEVYAQIQKIIDIVPAGESVIVMGDYNAKIGQGTEHPPVDSGFGCTE